MLTCNAITSFPGFHFKIDERWLTKLFKWLAIEVSTVCSVVQNSPCSEKSDTAKMPWTTKGKEYLKFNLLWTLMTHY